MAAGPGLRAAVPPVTNPCCFHAYSWSQPAHSHCVCPPHACAVRGAATLAKMPQQPPHPLPPCLCPTHAQSKELLRRFHNQLQRYDLSDASMLDPVAAAKSALGPGHTDPEVKTY